MMCADIGKLAETLRIFEETGVDYLHIDVMDGSFVPNFQLGADYVKQLRRLSRIPLDIHLMIERPEDKIGWFEPQAGDYVSVHAESTHHLQRSLQRIRDCGAKPMVALNPATPLSALNWVWDDIDAVLIMTVNPGYAGQKLIPQTLPKIMQCRARANEANREDIEIEVDGNVSLLNAVKMADAGADIYVLGSSCLFASSNAAESLPLDKAVERFRKTVSNLL
jgi:ribulose-phosphate 3-epimerase